MWWNEEPEPSYPPIVGWWTIGEAPNYEINDEGVVRHKPSGRIVKHHVLSPGPHGERVTLSAYGGLKGFSIKYLVETGRKYQGA